MGIKDVELGIDTWAVDYVLVGENGHKLEDQLVIVISGHIMRSNS